MTLGLVLGATGGIGGACVTALAGSVERMILVGRDAYVVGARIAIDGDMEATA